MQKCVNELKSLNKYVLRRNNISRHIPRLRMVPNRVSDVRRLFYLMDTPPPAIPSTYLFSARLLPIPGSRHLPLRPILTLLVRLLDRRHPLLLLGPLLRPLDAALSVLNPLLRYLLVPYGIDGLEEGVLLLLRCVHDDLDVFVR